MKTVFLRLLTTEDKAAALLATVRGLEDTNGGRRYDVNTESFRAIPGAPFAYWVSNRILSLFKDLPPIEADGRTAKVGLQTGDDFRFVRAAWAIRPTGAAWYPFAKGGAFSPFYSDIHLLVNWTSNGGEIRNFYKSGSDRIASRPQNTEFFFRPGLTWSDRTTKSFSARPWPRGGVFSVKGSAGFFPEAEFSALALLNSTPFNMFLSLLVGAGDAAARSYQVGTIGAVPWPGTSPELATLAGRAWSLKRSLDTRTETSHAFELPALIQVEGESLIARSSNWNERVQEAEAEIASIQREIDDRCFELYGITDDDRRDVREGFSVSSADMDVGAADEDADVDGDEVADAATDTATLAAELVSWAVGVAFGRFDVRLATGDRTRPIEPNPFDALPACSAAVLADDAGLPVAGPPAGYPVPFPLDGILVDDPGHLRDLATSVRIVFEAVFGASSDAVWQEVAALLDPRDHDLRNWLASGFFEHHVKCHSMSRRKAPIVWQLGVPSGKYSIWLYAHRLTRDSLFALARDIVVPKLALEESRRTGLVQDAGPNPTSKQRADLAAQDAIIEELRAFDDDVRRVAPLWNPVLDDGIVLVMAPFWRLVPGHRAWQQELKSRWDALVAGKYDWAHVAMHLWPERVVPKCATDRSLAIAHGLEEVFWVEGAGGKWLPRAKPTRSIDVLVGERTSQAVKAALADLLAAPGPAGTNSGRGRRGATAADGKRD